MTSDENKSALLVEPTALASLKAWTRQNYPDSHPFRTEVEAISPADTKAAVRERLPTLLRLARRARP